MLYLFMSIFVFVSIAWSDDSTKKQKTELKTEKQKVSYSLGVEIGRSFKGLKDEIDMVILWKGFSDSMQDRDLLMTPQESRAVKQEFLTRFKKKREAKRDNMADDNKKEGMAFLLENKTKAGVITTKSGLQYKIIRKGDGDKPKATDQVKVHYRGTLLNGEEFDSSYKRSKPATFRLNAVIQGWQEGLQLMSPGSKYQFFIPSELGYGERGAGNMIGPNATLIFEVELLDIVK
ncbi:MAG: Peptidyl-prolyl cis-trans isomerase [Candidatus Magnetoglobus multicellularis str. Araruama]|uniref:Peptidyl-prolyl cis-trans isomerase n=1 Tax=Candidatus Magnetoglobus multicellularis str. Araruama TaxID=890399 RepID=A0A1V1PBX2_9BACT|nr:MAG: Peptidyl-prolyl cis-trans isomerase [Candidatus Magnetoglobus multicellularis str. Araruama]